MKYYTVTTICFVVMKAAGIIQWNWWKCFIPVMIYVGLELFFETVNAAIDVADKRARRRNK